MQRAPVNQRQGLLRWQLQTHRQRRMCKKTPSQSFTHVLFQSRGQGHRLPGKHNIFASYQKRQYNDFMWRTRTSRDWHIVIAVFKNEQLSLHIQQNEKWELFRITRISVLISHTEWLIIIYFTITHCCLETVVLFMTLLNTECSLIVQAVSALFNLASFNVFFTISI